MLIRMEKLDKRKKHAFVGRITYADVGPFTTIRHILDLTQQQAREHVGAADRTWGDAERNKKIPIRLEYRQWLNLIDLAAKAIKAAEDKGDVTAAKYLREQFRKAQGIEIP